MRKKSNKKVGNDFEEKVQRCLNSGALWFDKADLKTEDYRIDCKYTDKGSFRITKEIIEKIWNDALDSSRLPKLVIGIKDVDGKDLILVCGVFKK